MRPYCFVTVDAETEVIESGMSVIAELRELVERRESIRIPFTWFVRFQRDWEDYLDADVTTFQRPVTRGYDGFTLAKEQLAALIRRGDEIGWHYHAHNWVCRDDLSTATRLEILRADLASCWRELRKRHPDLTIASFRFGWFFVPDYAIYRDLAEFGLTRDASIDPGCLGRPVASSSASFLRPPVTAPEEFEGLTLFPRSETIVVHDWSVVAHDFGWSRADDRKAFVNRLELIAELQKIAVRLKRDGGEFLTYEIAQRSLFGDLGTA
jgi:hypothetical protein